MSETENYTNINNTPMSEDNEQIYLEINPSKAFEESIFNSDDINKMLFNPTTWVDGGEPAIEADMLNRFETTLGGLMGPALRNEDGTSKLALIQNIVNAVISEQDSRASDVKHIVDGVNELSKSIYTAILDEIANRQDGDNTLGNRINKFELDKAVTYRSDKDNEESGTKILSGINIDPKSAGDSYVHLTESLIDLREVDIPILNSDRIYVGTNTDKEPDVSTNNNDYNATQRVKYKDKGSLTYKLNTVDNRIDSFKVEKITVNNTEDDERQKIITSIKIDPDVGNYDITESKQFVSIETGDINLHEVDIPNIHTNKVLSKDNETLEDILTTLNETIAKLKAGDVFWNEF